MEQNNHAVEANAVNAATQEEVNNNESSASGIQTEDLLQVLQAKDAELEKIRQEKDNYKKGMLKAKGKLEDDDIDSEDMDSLIERKLNEKLLSSKEAQLAKEKDDAIKALVNRNKELETALKNRSQISSGTGAGNSVETTPIADNKLSAEQVKSLKAKGWTDEKIELFKMNLMKNKS